MAGNKQVERQNNKLFKDAREYLVLIKQLSQIHTAIKNSGEELSPEKQDLFDRVAAMVNDSLPISQEVVRVRQELDALPSSAPRHKRRAVAKNLRELLGDRAMNFMDMFKIILEAGALYADDDSVSVATKEELTAELESTDE